MDISGLREQILANVKQVIDVGVGNARRANDHELLVRQDDDDALLKAVIVCNGKLRLEGAAADSVSGALQLLFNTTAEMLRARSEAWSHAVWDDGEQLVVTHSGALVAKAGTPESEDEVANGEGGEEGVVADGEKGEEGVVADGEGGEDVMDEGEDAAADTAALTSERPGKLKQVTKGYTPTGKPRGRPPKSAAKGVTKGYTPTGKPRGRPSKGGPAKTPGYVPTGKPRGRPKKIVT